MMFGIREIEKTDGKTYLAHTQCPSCKNVADITIEKSGYDAYAFGANIQDALPTLSASQREQLLTGICQDCWNKMKEEDDDA